MSDPSGPPEDPAPRRVRDSIRRCWIEPLTIRRGDDGRYVRKDGNEPPSQLLLPFKGGDAQ